MQQTKTTITPTTIKAFYTFSHCQMLSRHFNVAYFMAAEPVTNTLHATHTTHSHIPHTEAYNYICTLVVFYEAARSNDNPIVAALAEEQLAKFLFRRRRWPRPKTQ